MAGSGGLLRLLERGKQAELARTLGVSKSVISRDMQVIVSIWQEGGRCPRCGGFR
jgi:hypothetical protein